MKDWSVDFCGFGLFKRGGSVPVVRGFLFDFEVFQMAADSRPNRASSRMAFAAILWAVTILAGTPLSTSAQPAPKLNGKVSTSLNDFGFGLLHAVTDGRGQNVIVSPLSVSLALAMTYNGAAGDTRTAIAKTLGAASLTDRAFNRNNRSLLDALEKADPAVQIDVANALWVQAGFSISPDFLKLNRDAYDASAESLDFAGNPEHAVDAINAWVNEKTHTKIPRIISDISSATVLVLTDAVYFKGRWSVPFDARKSEERPFNLRSGASVKTPMMTQTGEYPYFENEAFQAIRLPYGNSRFAMYVFLPRKTGGLPDLLRALDEPRWSRWTGELAERKGQIIVPKFKSTFSQRLDKALKSMGMGIAFDERADFSRIHPPPPPLLISEVEHKTYVEVDEEGTEAAAATSVGIAARAIMLGPPPFEMVVNHPFFCAIAEQQSGALLFAGVVTDPTQR
jgi:serine protease inhibitor